MNKKAECNIIGIGGLLLTLIGYVTPYMIGAGLGVTTTTIHFRIPHLGVDILFSVGICNSFKWRNKMSYAVGKVVFD